MIKISFKSTLKIPLDELNRGLNDDSICLKIFNYIKSIERTDNSRRNYPGEEYKMTAITQGREYLTEVKVLEVDEIKNRMVMQSKNFQSLSKIISTKSGNEHESTYQVDYEISLNSGFRKLIEPFYAKGGLTYMRDSFERTVKFFDPDAKVETVASSVWKMPIEVAYGLSCAFFFCLFLLVYQNFPRFAFSAMSSSEAVECETQNFSSLNN